MPTLHILLRSPSSVREIQESLAFARPQDGVLLAQDAVLALKTAAKEINTEASRRDLKFYALKSDMSARSIPVIAPVQPIDYEDFIELLSQYDRTHS